MNKVHKIVKYFAIAFACLIIGSIISISIHGIGLLSNLFNDEKDINGNLEELEILDIKYDILDIDIKNSNIIIKEGASFKIESNDKYIRIKENNNKLIIDEKKHNMFKDKEISDLVISVPVNYIFSEVSVDSIVGNVNIEKLSTKKLDLDLGFGKVNIDNLTVLEKTDIDGGTGEITLKDSSLNNLELDVGAGNLKIEAEILGNSEIDSFVGKLDIVLLGKLDDYKIKTNKGIGKFDISGVEVSDNAYYGSGANSIIINGSIGEISVSFS